jgi:hypothetical protein
MYAPPAAGAPPDKTDGYARADALRDQPLKQTHELSCKSKEKGTLV